MTGFTKNERRIEMEKTNVSKFHVTLADGKKTVLDNSTVAFTCIRKIMTAILTASLVDLRAEERELLAKVNTITVDSGEFYHGEIARKLTAKVSGKTLVDYAKIVAPLLPVDEIGKKAVKKAVKTAGL